MVVLLICSGKHTEHVLVGWRGSCLLNRAVDFVCIEPSAVAQHEVAVVALIAVLSDWIGRALLLLVPLLFDQMDGGVARVVLGLQMHQHLSAILLLLGRWRCRLSLISVVGSPLVRRNPTIIRISAVRGEAGCLTLR